MTYYRVWFGDGTRGVPVTVEAPNERDARAQAIAWRAFMFGVNSSSVPEHIGQIDELDTGMMESHLAMKYAGLL